MKIPLDGITVYFPYDYVYPEQYDYMYALKQTLDLNNGGHCLLEMPTGTGKTVSLLSLIVSYQLNKPSIGKLIYCTRTVQEMDKVMQEIKRVFAYIDQELYGAAATATAHSNGNGSNSQKSSPSKPVIPIKKRKNLCVCLSARRNLCIHPHVSQFDDPSKVDSLCRNRTASWIRSTPSVSKSVLCEYYEGFDAIGTDAGLEGIYSLQDLKELGQSKKWCPYFLSRQLITIANIVVYNYQYMLDPKISNLVSKDLSKDAIVVFDEAHNIDNICIEALSVRLDRRVLHGASNNLTHLNKSVNDMQKTDAQRLQSEYEALVRGLASSSLIENEHDELTNTLIANPVLADDLVREAVPGNIRKAKHFLNFIKSFIEYIRNTMGANEVTVEESVLFVNKFRSSTRMRENQILALKFCHDRLQSLFRTLRIADLDKYSPLTQVSNFAALIGTYDKGFQVLCEPYDARTPHLHDPILRLVCQDASIAMQPVLRKFRNVIITSGTLSPIDFYPKILNFEPKIAKSFDMTLSRSCICPMIITKGNDQIPITSKFESRSDPSVIKNYGELLQQMSCVIPDGIVCFFTSYAYMEEIVCEWSKLNILQSIMENKLIFIETKDIVETSLALDSFKKACDCGRGAIFLSVARGKVAEGIDFDRHYGRCVILFGIPFQYSRSRVLQLRLQFIKNEHNISENEFLAFDALRQAAQCVGRVIRSKLDYGLMIFADHRYSRSDKRKKLPQWLANYLKQEYINLSTDVAVDIAGKFFKKMAQPHSKKDEIGKSLLGLRDIQRKLKQFKQQYTVHDHEDATQNQFAAVDMSLSQFRKETQSNLNHQNQNHNHNHNRNDNQNPANAQNDNDNQMDIDE